MVIIHAVVVHFWTRQLYQALNTVFQSAETCICRGCVTLRDIVAYKSIELFYPMRKFRIAIIAPSVIVIYEDFDLTTERIKSV